MKKFLVADAVSEDLVARVTGVNLDTATATELFTVPTGWEFYPTRIIVKNPSVAVSAVFRGSFG